MVEVEMKSEMHMSSIKHMPLILVLCILLWLQKEPFCEPYAISYDLVCNYCQATQGHFFHSFSSCGYSQRVILGVKKFIAVCSQ